MTILDKAKKDASEDSNKPTSDTKNKGDAEGKPTKPDPEIVSDNAQMLSAVES